MREGPIGLTSDGYFICSFSPYDLTDIISETNSATAFQKVAPELFTALAEESDEELNPVLFFYKLNE